MLSIIAGRCNVTINISSLINKTKKVIIGKLLVYKRNKYFRMCCGRKIFSFGGNSSSSSCQVTSHNPIVDYFLITEHSQVFFIYTLCFQWYEVHIFVFSRKCLRSCNIFCLYLVYMIYLPLAFSPLLCFHCGFFSSSSFPDYSLHLSLCTFF